MGPGFLEIVAGRRSSRARAEAQAQGRKDGPLQVQRMFLTWMLGEAAEQLGEAELARSSYERFLTLAALVQVAPGHPGERQKNEMEQWARKALVRLGATEQ
jgi:hypothetical protein